MKIKSMQMQSFRSHRRTGIGSLQRINIFLGRNAAGKSSILDAIAFALTGVCRGVDDGGKGIEDLISSDDGKPCDPMGVNLETDQGSVSRHSNEGPRSKKHLKIMTDLGLDEKILKVLSAPLNLLRMQPRRQEEIFMSMTGQNITEAQLLEGLKSVGINITDQDVMKILEPEARLDRLVYYKQKRIDTKREMANWVFTPTPGLIEFDPVKYAKLKESVSLLRSQMDFERGRVGQARDNLANVERSLVSDRSLLDGLKSPAHASLSKKNYKEIKEKLDAIVKMRAERKEAIDEYNKLAAESNALCDHLDSLKELGSKCSACGQKIEAKHIESVSTDLEKKIEAKNGRLDPLSVKVKELDAKLAESNEQFLNSQLTQSDKNQGLAEVNKETIAKLTKSIEDGEKRRDILLGIKSDELNSYETELAKIIDEYKSMDQAFLENERRVNVNKKRTELEDQLKETEQWIDALGPGGAVTQMMSSGGIIELIKSVNEIGQQLGVGEINVVPQPWAIMLNDRPIELASASEEFRVAAAFSVAFSKRSGARILLLDAAEILFGDVKDMFDDFILNNETDFDQIFLACSTDNLGMRPAIDGVSFYLVEKNPGQSSTVRLVNSALVGV